jgi:hypothetical protein
MNRLTTEHQLYLFTTVILFTVALEVLLPFFNYYAGTYAWWLCLVNIVLMLIYNHWLVEVKYKLENTSGSRNVNLYISLTFILIGLFVVLILEKDRVFYEIPETMGNAWVKREVVWDMILLLLVNVIVLTETSFFRFVQDVIDAFR